MTAPDLPARYMLSPGQCRTISCDGRGCGRHAVAVLDPDDGSIVELPGGWTIGNAVLCPDCSMAFAAEQEDIDLEIDLRRDEMVRDAP